MEEEKVEIETAAKGFNGIPVKQAIAPLKPVGGEGEDEDDAEDEEDGESWEDYQVPVNVRKYKIQGQYDILTQIP